MSEKPLTIIVLIVLAIAVTLYLRTENPRQNPGSSTAEDFGPAPDMSIPMGLNGKKVDLTSLHGKVVMIDFWATWCGPCKMSIPELQRIYSKHKDDGLEVIGISVDDEASRHEVDLAVKQLGMTYPVAMATDIPDIRSKYTFASIPQLFIIDRKGVIRNRINGYDPNADIEGVVSKLLKEKP